MGVVCEDDCFSDFVLERETKLKVLSNWGSPGVDSIDSEAQSAFGGARR